MNIQLQVADHQDVMRIGLKTMLARSNVEIKSEASNDRELFRQLKKKLPHVVLLDTRFADDDGLFTLRRLLKKYPDLPIIMWSTDENPTYVARSMALGASGLVLRRAGRRELVSTLTAAVEKDDAWTRQQRERFTGSPEPPEDLDVYLTPREREVVRQLAYGLPNKEIALALEISYETVKEHIQHILRKLDASDRTQVAVWAVQNKID